jgi:hypothetical protein
VFDVAQQEIGGAGCVNWSDPREPPIQPDRAEKEGVGNFIAADVVDPQSPGVEVTPLRRADSVTC